MKQVLLYIVVLLVSVYAVITLFGWCDVPLDNLENIIVVIMIVLTLSAFLVEHLMCSSEMWKIRNVKKENTEETQIWRKIAVFSYWIAAVLLLLTMFQMPVKRCTLRLFGKCDVAVVVEERKWFNRHSSGGKEFVYQFRVDGEVYKGHMKSDGLQVGDTIRISYCEWFANINLCNELVDCECSGLETY